MKAKNKLMKENLYLRKNRITGPLRNLGILLNQDNDAMTRLLKEKLLGCNVM